MLTNISSMDRSMRSITYNTGAMNAAVQGLNISTYRMNRDLGRPMRMMKTFMPW